MLDIRKRSMALCCCLFVVALGGCSAKQECDSPETRAAVLKSVSNDHANPLGKFAAENSTAKPGDGSAESERAKQQPLYLVGDKIVTSGALLLSDILLGVAPSETGSGAGSCACQAPGAGSAAAKATATGSASK